MRLVYENDGDWMRTLSGSGGKFVFTWYGEERILGLPMIGRWERMLVDIRFKIDDNGRYWYGMNDDRRGGGIFDIRPRLRNGSWYCKRYGGVRLMTRDDAIFANDDVKALGLPRIGAGELKRMDIFTDIIDEAYGLL